MEWIHNISNRKQCANGQHQVTNLNSDGRSTFTIPNSMKKLAIHYFLWAKYLGSKIHKWRCTVSMWRAHRCPEAEAVLKALEAVSLRIKAEATGCSPELVISDSGIITEKWNTVNRWFLILFFCIWRRTSAQKLSIKLGFYSHHLCIDVHQSIVSSMEPWREDGKDQLHCNSPENHTEDFEIKNMLDW